MLEIVLPVVLAYLVGAIPFGLIVSRLAGVRNLRDIGSGNIGATNVWRAVGPMAAAWVFVGDLGKGALAVMMAGYFHTQFEVALVSYDLFLVVCAVVAVLGHVFPVYIGFKGGKGACTGLGVMLVLLPVPTLIGVGAFVLVVAVTRFVSLGSMVGAGTLFVVVAVRKYLMADDVAPVYFYLTLLMAALIVLTHRQNIARLIGKTESRFALSSRSGKAGDHV